MKTPDEMMKVFLEFYRRHGYNPKFENVVKDMSVEEFDMVLGTFPKDEQAWFYEPADNTLDELAQMHAFNKFYQRYCDAKAGRTDYDNDKGCLVFTEKSSMLEMGLTLNTYLYFKDKGLYSAADVKEYIVETPTENLPEEELDTLREASFAMINFYENKLHLLPVDGGIE